MVSVDEILNIRRGLIAIDGHSGSGKSTFAEALIRQAHVRRRKVTLLHTDWFATWDDPVAWWSTMIKDVVRPLLRGEDVRVRPYAWRDGVPTPGPPIFVEWAPMILLEGVSSARTAIADDLAAALWVDGGSLGECLERAVRRDGEVNRAHLEQWQIFERAWFAVDKTQSRCQSVSL